MRSTIPAFVFLAAMTSPCSYSFATTGDVGSCCVDGVCIPDLTQQQCVVDLCGQWNGAGSTCAGELCPLPFGAVCCLPDGTCDPNLLTAGCPCAGGTLIFSQTCSGGCNDNGVPDECDILSGTSEDCNGNGIPDECDIADGTSNDCNGNGIPDECELHDDCAQNFGIDCNFDGVLNDCDPDCNGNGTSDICELTLFATDCAGDGGLLGNVLFGMITHDNNCAPCHGPGGTGGVAPPHRNYSRYRYQQKTSGCVFHNGGAFDLSLQDYANLQAYLSDLGPLGNGILDECETLADCDADGIADVCLLAASDPSPDCDDNGVPDECDIAEGDQPDCNDNGVPDPCEGLPDCNDNGVPDECDVADGTSEDCTANGIPDECEPDCNSNGQADSCDIADLSSDDCDANGIPDECEPDCNDNGINDVCDISSGFSDDVNGNDVPDECEPDCNGNGIPDDLDILPGDADKLVALDYGGGGPAIPDCDPPDGTALEDSMFVDFGPDCGSVEALRVAIRATHTWPGDVVAELHSPTGTVVTLFSRAGLTETDPACGSGECCGVDDDDIDIELGDGYANNIEEAASLAGSFHPDAGATVHPGVLAAFVGEAECGTWTLRLLDGSPFDSGVLQGWQLDFRLHAVASDCNANGIPDDCDIEDTTSGDCNANGLPDECEDCNGNGMADDCDLDLGISDDCNGNGVLDECEAYRDCNANDVLDDCDIADGRSLDCDGNGAPDECDLAGSSGLFVAGLSSANVAEFDAIGLGYLGDFIPSGTTALASAWSVAFTPEGRLLVGDTVSSSILSFDGDSGAPLETLVESGAGGLVSPVNMLFRDNGNLLVLDQGGVVRQYHPTFGSSMGVFAELPTGGSAFDMAWTPDGTLLVTDFLNGAIQAYSGTDGSLLGAYTSGGDLQRPVALALNAAGELFVADMAADNIQRFASDGTFIEIFASPLSGGAQLFLGQMEFGVDGHLFLSGGLASAIRRFDGDDGSIFEDFSAPGLAVTIGLTLRPPANDCNDNGVPDDCEDCNGNALADVCDIADGTSQDADGNGIPDECQGADIALEVVVRRQDDGVDSATALPQSDGHVQSGEQVFIELWASDRGAVNTGVEQVYVNMTFDPDMLYAESVDHRPPFTDNIFDLIDNNNGVISSLGGRDSSSSGVGVEPEWRRVAVVQALALNCEPTAVQIDLALPGITAVDRGLITNLSFGAAEFAVDAACVYDLADDGSGLINSADLGIFAACWLTSTGQPGYDRDCDFNCDGAVNAGDLGWFAVGWLRVCEDLTPADVPECRACIDGPSLTDPGGADGGGLAASREQPGPRSAEPRPAGKRAQAQRAAIVQQLLDALAPQSASPGHN